MKMSDRVQVRTVLYYNNIVEIFNQNDKKNGVLPVK